jgi:hypothetical protein
VYTYAVQDKREYSIKAEEVVAPPWWLLALVAGVGGIAVIGGIIWYEEDRKRRLWELAKK